MRWWLAAVGACAIAAGCMTPPEEGGGGATSSSSGAGAGPVTSAKPECGVPPPTGGLPSARADSAGALRADGRTMVMFGGDVAVVVCGATPKRDHVGDTWLLDTACGGWTQLMTAGPSPRARHAMASDAKRDRALLFGGRYRDKGQTDYTLFNDTWAFDFTNKNWAQLPTKGTPPAPRANTAMAVDGDTLWLFGGSTSPSGLTFTPTSDLYALDLITNEWRGVLGQGTPPSAREFHAMAIDGAAHKAYVGWGGDANAFVGPFFKDIAVLDLAAQAWSPLAVAPAAGADVGRIKLGMAVRSASAGGAARLYAFAGHDDGALGNRNDLLATDLGGAAAWQAEIKGDAYNKPPAGQCSFAADFVIDDPKSLERRSSFAFAPLPSGEAFVVFGGDSDCGRLSDAWWYDTRAARWTAIAESLPGLTCPRTGSTSCKSLCG